MRITCSAKVVNPDEREQMTNWVRQKTFSGYSVLSEVVTVDYQSNTSDLRNRDSSMQEMIDVFERYSEHSIEYSNS